MFYGYGLHDMSHFKAKIHGRSETVSHHDTEKCLTSNLGHETLD